MASNMEPSDLVFLAQEALCITAPTVESTTPLCRQ